MVVVGGRVVNLKRRRETTIYMGLQERGIPLCASKTSHSREIEILPRSIALEGSPL
jgi:hypothetical protein